MEGLNPQQYEQALGLTTEIIRRMHDHIGHSPYNPNYVSTGEMAQSFFAPPDDQKAADNRVIATALSLALNPQTPAGTQLQLPGGEVAPIEAILGAAGYDTQKVFERAKVNDWGYPYTGGGWSKEERQALGRDPGAYELSPGDHQAYQRTLNTVPLRIIRNAVEQLYKSQEDMRKIESEPDFDRFSESPDPRYTSAMLVGGNARSALRDVVNAHDASYGKDKGKNASSFFGSTYPQHRGGGAVADALSNPGSPIAWFMDAMDANGQALANGLMGQPDPAYRASVASQGWNQWSRPSPHHVPSGSPEERDRYIAEARRQTEQVRAPSWSMHRMRETGEPPSYVGQGLANLGYMFADPSNVAAFGAGKGLHMAAKAAAPRLASYGMGGMAGYAARLAGKTQGIASGKLAPFLLRESSEEVPSGAAMQGAATLADSDRPGFFDSFKPGLQNRPDIKAALLAEGVDPNDRKAFEEYYDKQQREAQAAVSDLAYKNAQSPYHSNKRGLGRVGSAIGETGTRLLDASQRAEASTPSGWWDAFRVMR